MILPLTKMGVGTVDRVIEKGARTYEACFSPAPAYLLGVRAVNCISIRIIFNNNYGVNSTPLFKVSIMHWPSYASKFDV